MYKKIIKLGLVIVATISAFLFIYFFTSNTTFLKKEFYVHIPTGANYNSVKKIISPYISNYKSFEFLAALTNYTKNSKSGRFLFKKGMSSFQLIATLRHNVPVNLAFNNQERLENLCVRISSQIEPDTTKLLAVFTDVAFLKQNNFNKNNVIALFIPNSYQFYWNVTATKFRDKMLQEYTQFWTIERLQKAKKLNLSAVEVITLASIVHKETVKIDERPIVAKVYLNRLAIGMPLQADPTVIYSLKLRDNNFDQVIKRVLYGDLLINSAYNTYKITGLPPGPIAMPDISAIDAVLNPSNNDYIYFCASVTRFGYHEFASTLSQHGVNRKKYIDWLNMQGTAR